MNDPIFLVNKIQRLYSKAMLAMKTDPEVALMLARKTAEAICKVVHAQYISENTGSMMLDKLIEQLTAGGHLPKRILTHLRTVQVHGNFGSHDQGDEKEIDQDYILSCMHSLNYVYTWALRQHLLPKLDKLTVRELAGLLGLKPFQLNKDMIEMNIFPSANQVLEKDVITAVARKHGLAPD